MSKIDVSSLVLLFFSCFGLAALSACHQGTGDAPSLDVPRGYMQVIEIQIDDRLIGFGPFVGYYFKPESPDNFERIQFVCFNENSFYTSDLPENTKLFEGEAILTRLSDVNRDIPAKNRINPIYFKEAPQEWLESRPDPKEEFLHFHSGYDSRGPVLYGYWIRHQAKAAFAYDMGGRVGAKSVLYHQVTPGVDKDFARIIEFDRGPGKE